MSDRVQLQILKNLAMLVGIQVANSRNAEGIMAMEPLLQKLDEENRAVITEAELQ